MSAHVGAALGNGSDEAFLAQEDDARRAVLRATSKVSTIPGSVGMREFLGYLPEAIP